MKKTILVLTAFLICVIAACQNTGQTFEEMILVKKGIKFADGSILNSALGSGQVTWASITGKPTVFAPATHNHDASYKAIGWLPNWDDIQNKPYIEEMNLVTALPLMDYLPLPQKTTAEIDALVIPEGVIALVWDNYLNVGKLWDGEKWTVIITNK